MNKNDFRTAYDKIVLPEDVKAEMKKKLLARMAENKASDSADEAEFHPAAEIRIEPKKRHTGRTVAIAGSAAAVALAVGVGFWFNRDSLIQNPNVNHAVTRESTSEATDETTEEASCFSRAYALGELKFQEFTPTTADHLQPSSKADNDEIVRYFSENMGILLEEFAKSGGKPGYLNGMSVSECYTDDNGWTVILRSEDGKKQVNFSISRKKGDFTPITLPDGSYIYAAGEPKSSFAYSWVNFIDPECWKLAAGSYEHDGSVYYAAEYDFARYDSHWYCRIDAKDVTQEEFLSCIDDGSPAYLSYDHKGWYCENISAADQENIYDNWRKPQTGVQLPQTSDVDTTWGTLTLSPLTAYPARRYGSDGYWNVFCDSGSSLPEGMSYSLADAAEYSGLDVLSGISSDSIFGVSGNTTVLYTAAYDGITSGLATDERMGANLEMLPGDDRQQFDEAQKYVNKGVYTDGDASAEVEYGEYYSTDKLPYFSGKDRTSVCYAAYIKPENVNSSAYIAVFDDWNMAYDSYMDDVIFARYPAESSDFTDGVSGAGSLYTAFGYDDGGMPHYVGGFSFGSGKYLLLDMFNADIDEFAELIAKLYSNGNAVPRQDVTDGRTTLANGELIYHDGDVSGSIYSRPNRECTAEEANSMFRELVPNAAMPGMDEWFRSQLSDITERAGESAADSVKSTRPLADELELSGAYYNDTGFALEFSQGSRQLTFSVSTRGDEFLPVIIDGSNYLEYNGAYDSWATVNGGYDFIDPEKFSLGLCQMNNDYYLAKYSLKTDGVTRYFRLYSKGLTREQFEKCLEAVSPVRTGDHMGNYSPDGSYIIDVQASVTYDRDDLKLPESTTAETEWGKLQLDTLTYTASPLNATNYNVQAFYNVNELKGSGYSLSEIVELCGKTVLDNPEKLFGGSEIHFGYAASYEGISNGAFDSDHGINSGMLPGDDPAQFAEAQQHVAEDMFSSPLVDAELSRYYDTDRIDYFKDKKRTGVRYTLNHWIDDERSVSVTVTDAPAMLDAGRYIFGRLPAQYTDNFSKAQQRVYAGYGQISGNDVYMGGFRSGGCYIVVTAKNTGLREFARVLAALCEDSASPETVQSAEYPEPTYNMTGSLDNQYEAGRVFVFNQMKLTDRQAECDDLHYFATADEAAQTFTQVQNADGRTHSTVSLLENNGWTLVPEKSAAMDYNGDVPTWVSLYFEKDGGRTGIYVKTGTGDMFSDPLGFTLAGGKRMEIGGVGLECSLKSYEQLILNDASSDDYQFGIAGRYESGVNCYIAETTSRKPSDNTRTQVQAMGSSMTIDDVMDVFAALLYDLPEMK